MGINLNIRHLTILSVRTPGTTILSVKTPGTTVLSVKSPVSEYWAPLGEGFRVLSLVVTIVIMGAVSCFISQRSVQYIVQSSDSILPADYS